MRLIDIEPFETEKGAESCRITRWFVGDGYSTQVVTHADVTILPEDVAAMLALLKIARIASGHAKEDNWIDLAGYAACGCEIETEASS